MVLALVVVLFLVLRPHTAPVTATADQPSAPGTFRPTDEQWRALSFATVSSAPFPEAEETEGQIGADDDQTVQVFPPFSGHVKDVLVKAGDKVAKGQPLVSMMSTELAQGRADLDTAAANLASAKIQLGVADANATRQQALFAASGAAQRDVQQANADLAAAKAVVSADESAVAAVRDRLRILGYGDSDLTGAARGSAAAAQVRAPISGVVIQRQVGPGQYLNSTANGATTPLFTISDLATVWLVANVRENDAARVKLGDPMNVRVLALPGRSFQAKVAFVAPTIDPATRRLTVRAAIANPDGSLKPGMFADFSIVSHAGDVAPETPASSVVYDGPNARVWVAGADHSLALRQIQAGRSHDGMIEVLSGLSPGDRVVSAGALFIDRAAKSD